MKGNKMKVTKAGLFILVWVAMLATVAPAQVPYRLNDKEMESLMKRIEDSSDRFRKSFDHSLDKSHIGGKDKDHMKDVVKEFENATDHLKDHFSKKNSAVGDVEEVLNRAAQIDEFMARDIFDSRAKDDWMNLRANLDELARAYNVSWNWGGRHYRGSRFIRNGADIDILLDRTRRDADRFRESLNFALAEARIEETQSGSHIDLMVTDLQTSIDLLRDRYRRNDLTSNEVTELLHRSENIGRFMRRNLLDSRAQSDWMTLRHDVDQIAQAYEVAWNR